MNWAEDWLVHGDHPEIGWSEEEQVPWVDLCVLELPSRLGDSVYSKVKGGCCWEVGQSLLSRVLLLPVARPLLPKGSLSPAELADPGGPDICVHNPTPVQSWSLKGKERHRAFSGEQCAQGLTSRLGPEGSKAICREWGWGGGALLMEKDGRALS